jgi:hypothetical protein
VQSGYKEYNWGDPVSCQLIGSSAQEAVKTGPEGVKLKNMLEAADRERLM